MPARQLIFLYLKWQPFFPITYRMHIAYFFPKKPCFACIWHIFFTNVFDISILFNPNVKQHVNDIKQSCKESVSISAKYYQQQHRLLLAINNCVIAFSADSFHLIIYPFSVQPPMCKFSQSSLIVFVFLQCLDVCRSQVKK